MEPKMKFDPNDSVYRNRFHIQAKLPPQVHRAFLVFCHERNLSFNSAVKHLISSHPDIQIDG